MQSCGAACEHSSWSLVPSRTSFTFCSNCQRCTKTCCRSGRISDLFFQVYGEVNNAHRADELLNAVQSWSDSLGNVPVFICGDFNLTQEESQVLQKWVDLQFFTDLHVHSASLTHTAVVPTTVSGRRIDHVWANRQGLRLVRSFSVLLGLIRDWLFWERLGVWIWQLPLEKACFSSGLPGAALAQLAAIVNPANKPTKVKWSLSWSRALGNCGKAIL